VSAFLIFQLVCLAGQLVCLVLTLRNARRAGAANARARADAERADAAWRRMQLRGGRP
jgi:cell division protein FtsL